MFNDSPSSDVAIDADDDDISRVHPSRLSDIGVIGVINANRVVVTLVG